MTETTTKQPRTVFVPCSPEIAAAVEAEAARRGVSTDALADVLILLALEAKAGAR